MVAYFKGLRLQGVPSVSFVTDEHSSKPIWNVVPTCYPECGHSPDGFEWGYSGSGPSQLAYAILRFLTKKWHLSDVEGQALVIERYAKFKEDFIAKLPKDEWKIELQDVLDWWKSWES